MLLFILTSPFWSMYFFSKFAYSVFELIYLKYKFKILRVKVKAKFAYLDYKFMTNLSIGIFASSLVAMFVAESFISVVVFSITITISAIAMIDYNYKNKYNKEERKRRILWKR